MAAVEAVEVSVYYGKLRALCDVTLRAGPSEVVSVIGPNGSGKTTLLKTLGGILRPSKGAIYIDGRNVHEYARRELAKIVAYVPQRTEVVGHMTTLDFVLTGRRPHVNYVYGKRDVDKVYEALRIVECEKLALRRLDQLSGGEHQRVLIARALAAEPRLLLLDEPTSSLDPRYQIEILELVRRLVRERNVTVMMSTHDLTQAYRYSDKVVVLKDGRVVAEGSPDKVIDEDLVIKVFGVKAKVLKGLRAVVLEGADSLKLKRALSVNGLGER